MLSLLFVCLLAENFDVAMKVLMKDPVFPISVTSLEHNKRVALPEQLDTGFVMFLSAQCGHCERAFELVGLLREQGFPVVVLFPERREKVLSFLEAREGGSSDGVFLVDASLLTPYNIKIFPAVVGFMDGELRMATHGPLDHTYLDRMIRGIEGKRKLVRK